MNKPWSGASRNIRTAITYVLGQIEATGANLYEETQHRLTMAQLKGMPMEMLDRANNLYRLKYHGINLDHHPQYRSYQTFYEMGIAPSTHQEMADVTIQVVTELGVQNRPTARIMVEFTIDKPLSRPQDYRLTQRGALWRPRRMSPLTN